MIRCAFLAVCALVLASSSAFSQGVKLSKVDLAKVVKEGNVFPIEGGEITVGGNLLKRIEIGKSTAVITYFNKGDSLASPRYLFRIFNAYGLEISRFEDRWAFDKLKPSETKKEDKTFYISDLKRAFQYSGIVLPDDWATPVYVLVEVIP